MIESCARCRYSVRSMIQTADQNQPPIESFECLVMPGQVIVVGDQIMTVFPRRTAKGWCRLFKLSWWKLLSRSNG